MTIGQIVIWSLVSATLATITFSFLVVLSVAAMAKLSRAMWLLAESNDDDDEDCNP